MLSRAMPTRTPILLYHSISPDPPGWIAPFAVSPAAFAAQLDAVIASGRQPLTVSRYADGLCGRALLPPRPVLITVDDGFADFAEFALPALAERNLPATLYVTTGALADRGGDSALPAAAMLRSTDLPGLEAAGVEIGAHSHTHRQLDLLPGREVTAELTRSRNLLAEVLGHTVRSFAYPHGYWRARVRRLAGAAGFDSACAVGEALSSAREHRLALSRLTVRAGMPVAMVTGWLEDASAAPPRHGPAAPSRRVLAFGWREYRRVRTSQRRAWLS